MSRSIMQDKSGGEHHAMHGTANRKLAEHYGLKVYLCPYHHRNGPEADKIKNEEEYLNYAVRTHKNGYRYIVVKDGFEVLAAIMPVKVLSPAYMDQLRMFYHMCEQQARKEWEPQEKGTEDDE